jgi:hypothetical protein
MLLEASLGVLDGNLWSVQKDCWQGRKGGGTQSVQGGSLQSIQGGSLQRVREGSLQSVGGGSLQSVRRSLQSVRRELAECGEESLQRIVGGLGGSCRISREGALRVLEGEACGASRGGACRVIRE